MDNSKLTIESIEEIPAVPRELPDNEHVKLALAYLVRDIGDIKRFFARNQFDVDMYLSDNGSNPTGVITPQKVYNGSWMIQLILATWDPTSAVAKLTIGDRIIPLPVTAGTFSAQVEMQVQRDDVINFTVTAGKACHIELMGSADIKRFDRT